MSRSAGQRLEKYWPECQYSKGGHDGTLKLRLSPELQRKRCVRSAFIQLHVFPCPRFLHDFSGDDVTRFLCGYIYIYHLYITRVGNTVSC